MTLYTDYVVMFGTPKDGAIESIVRPRPDEYLEMGYYFGTLKPRGILDISSQVGCPVSCRFCELGTRRFGRSLTAEEMVAQVELLKEFARRWDVLTAQQKVTIAKSGEPLLNSATVSGLEKLSLDAEITSFKLCTVMPRGRLAERVFADLLTFAHGDKTVQLQISLIATNDVVRVESAGPAVLSLAEIAKRLLQWRNAIPTGRKPNVSMIVDESNPLSPGELVPLIPPELTNIRLRPYVPTINGDAHTLVVASLEKLRNATLAFENAGYTVFNTATPTPTEWRFSLSANSELERYRRRVGTQ